MRCPTAAGAALWPPTGRARTAGRPGCGRSSRARSAPPRNWAGRSLASPSEPQAAPLCSRLCRRRPRSSSRRRARSRSRRTPRRCCSTAGRCSAALVRPAGTVRGHADAGLAVTQALIRWDPAGFADRELADRVELGFPPAVRMASVSGTAEGVASLLSALEPGFEVLGPIPVERSGPLAPGQPDEEEARALVRAPRSAGSELAHALHVAQAARSARKEGGGVRVQLDPAELI